MAVTLVNASGFAFGVAADETGMNMSTRNVTYKPEFKENLVSRQNEKIGFAIGETETEISLSGEVHGALVATAFATATTLAETPALFSASGGVYLNEATLDQGRSAWKTASLKFSMNHGIS